MCLLYLTITAIPRETVNIFYYAAMRQI